jgi:peptidoglycan/xylan/chitin deacetylase (PgdA/CDA1 family)
MQFKVFQHILREFYCSLYSVTPFYNSKGIRILCYHDIPTEFKQKFKEHLQFIIKEFKIISLSKAVEKLKKQNAIDEPYLVITFDDGYRSFLHIMDYFKNYEISATLFIIAGFIGKSGYLTEDEIILLNSQGFEIGCHTLSHPNLAQCSYERIWTELIESKQILSNLLGEEIDLLALPYGGKGAFTKDVLLAALKAGYRVVLTTYRGWNLPSNVGMVNNRLLILRRDPIEVHWSIKVLKGILKGAMDFRYHQWPKGICNQGIEGKIDF